MFVWMYAVCGWPWRPEEGIRFPKLEWQVIPSHLIGSTWPSGRAATEPLLQPPHYIFFIEKGYKNVYENWKRLLSGLRALQGSGLVPRIHLASHNIGSSSSRRPNSLFGPPGTRHPYLKHTYIQVNPQTQKIKLVTFLKSPSCNRNGSACLRRQQSPVALCEFQASQDSTARPVSKQKS